MPMILRVLSSASRVISHAAGVLPLYSVPGIKSLFLFYIVLCICVRHFAATSPLVGLPCSSVLFGLSKSVCAMIVCAQHHTAGRQQSSHHHKTVPM